MLLSGGVSLSGDAHGSEALAPRSRRTFGEKSKVSTKVSVVMFRGYSMFSKIFFEVCVCAVYAPGCVLHSVGEIMFAREGWAAPDHLVFPWTARGYRCSCERYDLFPSPSGVKSIAVPTQKRVGLSCTRDV